MKRTIKHIKKIAICLAVIFTASCSEDFLENINKDAPSNGVILGNVENAQLALDGLIGSMTNRVVTSQSATINSQERGGYPIQLVQMDFLGEDIPFVAGDLSFDIRYQDAYTWEMLTGAESGLVEMAWAHSYAIINQANLILDNIDGTSGPDSIKDNIKGQTLTVRAFAYLHLVQLFGDRYVAGTENTQLGPVIYTTSTQDTAPRSTVGETYTLINSDLERAIDLLTEERDSKYYINKNIAQGIMARVALIQEDWDLAITMADAALAGFPLMENADYLTGFNDVSNQEWLWAWPRELFNANFFGHFFVNMTWNGNSGHVRENPKRILSTLYDDVVTISDTDIRLANFSRDIPGDDRFQDIDENGDPFTAFGSHQKVPYHAFKFKARDWRRGNLQQGDTPAMRAAEMLLIKAEAQQRNGDDGTAAMTLFELNSNRDANAVLSTNTGQDLLEEIWLYRRLELWGEGFRFLDLKRNNLPLDRTDANHDTTRPTLLEVPAGDPLWTYPIPEIESRLNNNID
ncbi:RagB/SusD family nutrient uptake outer membrane protein [Flavivirga abyssicola]|uniref:RagB/SusD family nutrient uptake outer membrane protein n=1 Tax=Flavivirga abyssicola TaxID=3063533 RepID=UPI0026DF0DB3|nr:RagB/SusD family nutrient uptake outer membrane protein [Flavivirga sp. MEBiC07777]WVK13810.1 RagB/SusD family nutrient uptake outer membrane protein [Flavivirga sp. MEBiC07777]